MKYTWLLASVAVCAPMSAHAADLPISDTTMVVASAPWEGFYTGLQTTFGRYNSKDDIGSPKTKTNGWGFGGFAGYNAQIGDIVLGVEFDASYYDISKINQQNNRVRLNWSAGASVRAGYAIDNFLPYLRAGVGLHDGHVKNVVSGLKSDSTHTYVEFGGGIETMLTDNVSLRAEVVHRISSKESYTQNTTYNAESNATSGRLGLSYHF